MNSWFDNGQVEDIDESSGTNVEPEEVFASTDIDWPAILNGIPAAQQAMESAGTRTTEVTHIIVVRARQPMGASNELVARVYLRDAFDDGGYVELAMDGSIRRVAGP